MKSEELIFSDNTPGLFSGFEIEEINNYVTEAVSYVKTLNAPRLIIIETWLIIDFMVRHILLSAFDIENISDKSFDPHYDLLPNSFRECLASLEKFIKVQRNLPEKPEPTSRHFTASTKLLIFINNKYPKLLKQITKAEDEFNREFFGIQDNQNYAIVTELNFSKKQYRTVSQTWLKSVDRLDKNWFAQANKINKGRNESAHNFDASKIYSIFGINSKNKMAKVVKLRKYCLKSLTDLIGIIPS